jgi:energy-coupling factor transporter transmembrane protein EcfT
MAENDQELPDTDNSCEIISFIVLAILSALSHFWFILIIFSAVVVLRRAFSFASQFVVSSLQLIPWHAWKNAHTNISATEIQHQVFKPSKIG